MTSRKIRRVPGVEQTIAEKLAKQKIITCKDLLSRNHLELLTLTGLSYEKIQNLVKAVSKCVAPTEKTALAIKLSHTKDKSCFLSTSLPSLDNVLMGGLPSSTLTEITGPPGSGKTQFSILLAIMATLPQYMGGLNGNVIYIDTEAAFSAQRLVEMASSRFPDLFNSSEKQEELLSKVHVFLESTCLSLWSRLEHLEEDIISNGVKIIILDSIASLVRKEFDTRTTANITERTALLSKEAMMMKYIAEKFEIPILVTNQITTVVSKLEQDVNYELELIDDASHVTAALGNTWAHAINTRLTLQYLDQGLRQIMVTKSPLSPYKIFTYSIQTQGIILEKPEEDKSFSKNGCNPLDQKIRSRSSV